MPSNYPTQLPVTRRLTRELASDYPRDLFRIDPLIDLHREMSRLFDTMLSGAGAFMHLGVPSGVVRAPRVDMQEQDDEICICAELPGVKASEVDVTVDGDVLTICGAKSGQADAEQDGYHLMERSFGQFRRTIALPFRPDPAQIRAEYDQGVLTVHVAKQDEAERSCRIEVQDASGSPTEPRNEPRGKLRSETRRGGSNDQGDGPGTGAEPGPTH